jgi:rhamnose utilization protein RhaD (predicted bifunctional aldolase and dehydrogenase)
VTARHEGEARELRRVSALLGRDVAHVQGAGGNTSLKLDSEWMLVKASGYLLKDAEQQDMFARVAFSRVREALVSGAADPLRGTSDAAGARPSIETTLHALMPHRVVLHTHSIPVLATACLADAQARFDACLTGLSWAFVEYARPGTPLAQAVRRALARSADVAILILQNHGVVVGAESAQRALELLEEVCSRVALTPRVLEVAPDHQALESLARLHALSLPVDQQVHTLALHPVHLARAQAGTLYPDHVVFLGPKVGVVPPVPADGDAALAAAASKLWLVPGKGALLAPGLPAAALAMARCLADVAALLPEASACRYLSAGDEAELLGMEEEKHRQALARGVA